MEEKLCSFEKKFIDFIRMKKYSSQTEKAYLYHLKKFTDFKYPTHQTRMSSQDIHDYLLYLNTKNVSDSYYNQAINAIRFFFKYVLNKKIKDYLVVRPKKAKTQPILLSDNELQELLNKCNNLKHKSILSLIASSGLRVSEIVNLKIEDIDSKCMIIRVRSSKGRKDRQCLLDRNVLKLLREYYKEYKPKEYLFNGQFSSKYTTRSIEEFTRQYALKANIKKRVYPHLLRHQQITGLIENGTDIYATQYHSGHSSMKTTSGYIHLSPKYISNIQSPLTQITWNK